MKLGIVGVNWRKPTLALGEHAAEQEGLRGEWTQTVLGFLTGRIF